METHKDFMLDVLDDPSEFTDALEVVYLPAYQDEHTGEYLPPGVDFGGAMFSLTQANVRKLQLAVNFVQELVDAHKAEKLK